MNETIKQFTADLLKDFQASLVKNQDVVAAIKAAGDNAGSFKVVISTADEDRQGDQLDQSKWKLENYKENPVVLWAHNYTDPPIGICTSISVEGGQLIAVGKFAPSELNPFAAQIAGLYDAGFIKATSVGYMQHEDGYLELLEFSFVPVPANPFALSLRDVKNLGLNMPQLVMKGLTFEAKAEQIGDRCEMDDGTLGILATDPDDPGQLVCVPADGGKSKANEDINNELSKNLKAEQGRHGEAVAKAIDEFKAVDELKSALGTENDGHLEKCMKAIDDSYELQDQKKSIDEFKAAMQSEHGEHVKSFEKGIEEFKSIEEFEKSAGVELERHAKAQMDLCKAEMGEGETNEQKAANEINAFLEKALAATTIKCDGVDVDPKVLKAWANDLLMKSGRAISAANKAKLEAATKSLDDLHEAHAKALNDLTEKHKKDISNVTAALKAIASSGSGGEEQEPQKEVIAPQSKVEVRDIRPADGTFEAFMANRRVLRTVDAAVGKALEDLNKTFKKQFPDRR
jgi:hypothetical protein